MSSRDPFTADVQSRIEMRLQTVIEILFSRALPWHPIRNFSSNLQPLPDSPWPGRDLFLQRKVWGNLPRNVEIQIQNALPTADFPTEQGLISLYTLSEAFHHHAIVSGGQHLVDNAVIERYYRASIDQGAFSVLPNGAYRISYQDVALAMDRPRLKIKRLFEILWKTLEALSVPEAIHTWELGSIQDHTEQLVIPPNGDINVIVDANLDLWMIAVEDELNEIYQAFLSAHNEIRMLRFADLFGEILANHPNDQQSLQDFNQRQADWVTARNQSIQASNLPRYSGPGFWTWAPQIIEFYVSSGDPRQENNVVTMLQNFNIVAKVAGVFTPNSSARQDTLEAQLFNRTRQLNYAVTFSYYDDVPVTVTIGSTTIFTSELYFVSNDIVFNHPHSDPNTVVGDVVGFPGEDIHLYVENQGPYQIYIVEGDEDDEPQPYYQPDPIPLVVFRPINPANNQPGRASDVFPLRYDPQEGTSNGPLKVYLENNGVPVEGFDIVWIIYDNTNPVMSFYTVTDEQGIARFEFSWQGKRQFHPAPDLIPVMDKPIDAKRYRVEAFPGNPVFGSFIERHLAFTVNLIAPSVISFTTTAQNISQRSAVHQLLGDSPFLVKAELGRHHEARLSGQSFTMNLSSSTDSTTVEMRALPNDSTTYYSVQTVTPNTFVVDFGANDIDIVDQSALRAHFQLGGESETEAQVLYVSDGNDIVKPNQTRVDARTRFETLILESALNEVAVGIDMGQSLGNEGERYLIEHKLKLLRNARRFMQLDYETHQFNTPTLAYRNFVVGEYIKLITNANNAFSERNIPDLMDAHGVLVQLTGIFPTMPQIQGVDSAEIRIINDANDYFLTDINLQVLRTIRSYIVGGLDLIGNVLVQFVLPIDSFKAVFLNETPDGFQATFTERVLGAFEILPFIPRLSVFRPVSALPNPGGTNFRLRRVGNGAQALEKRVIHSFVDTIDSPSMLKAFRTDSVDSMVPILQQRFVDDASEAVASRLASTSSARRRLENSLQITSDKITAASRRMKTDHEDLVRLRSELAALRQRIQAGERSATLFRQFAKKDRRLLQKTAKIGKAKIKFFDHLIERERQFNRALGNASGANLPDSVVQDMIANGQRIKAHDKVRGKKAWDHYEDDVLEHLNGLPGTTYPFTSQDSIRLNTTYVGRYPASYGGVPAGVEKKQMIVRLDMVNAQYSLGEVKYYFFNDILHDANAVQKKANMLWESIQKGRKVQFTLLKGDNPTARNLDLWDQANALPFTVFTPQPVPQSVIDGFIHMDPAMARVKFEVLAPNYSTWLTR